MNKTEFMMNNIYENETKIEKDLDALIKDVKWEAENNLLKLIMEGDKGIKETIVNKVKEECVKIAEEMIDNGSYDTYPLVDYQDGWNSGMVSIAKAIRE